MNVESTYADCRFQLVLLVLWTGNRMATIRGWNNVNEKMD